LVRAWEANGGNESNVAKSMPLYREVAISLEHCWGILWCMGIVEKVGTAFARGVSALQALSPFLNPFTFLIGVIT
jgi:hypothetical protein